jgi:hypothetical protein
LLGPTLADGLGNVRRLQRKYREGGREEGRNERVKVDEVIKMCL